MCFAAVNWIFFWMRLKSQNPLVLLSVVGTSHISSSKLVDVKVDCSAGTGNTDDASFRVVGTRHTACDNLFDVKSNI